MLAVAPGCELEVERGPDWLLVRVANLDLAEPIRLRWRRGFGLFCSSTSPIGWCWNSTKSAC